MSYNKTIFRQMLQISSRLEFLSIVKKYKGDYRVRKLNCWSQFIHLLFAQLGDRNSLRDTVECSASQSEKLYHLGCSATSRSTLADANNKRPFQMYRELFFKLLDRTQRIAPKYKLKLPKKLYIMDSTTVDLCLKLFPWARFRKTKGAVKLHTLMQADGLLPTFLTVTDGTVHDSKGAKKLNVESGSFIVFDRGYHDFRLYKRYTDNKIRFVTKMKTNAQYETLAVKINDKKSGVLSDETIRFTGYYTHKKYPNLLRKITFYDKKTNKKHIFLSNEFDLDAAAIAAVYKARWEVELFFKTIKQNLKIKRFMGNSRNAVLTQIYVAMIAYLLVSYHKFTHKSKHSIQKLIRLIQINLFERKPLDELIKYAGSKPPDAEPICQCSLIGI